MPQLTEEPLSDPSSVATGGTTAYDICCDALSLSAERCRLDTFRTLAQQGQPKRRGSMADLIGR